jgi:hypothetical protein
MISEVIPDNQCQKYLSGINQNYRVGNKQNGGVLSATTCRACGAQFSSPTRVGKRPTRQSERRRDGGATSTRWGTGLAPAVNAARGSRDRAKTAAGPSIHPCQPRRRGAMFRAGRDTGIPERGPDAGTIDQVSPQHGPLAPDYAHPRLLDLSSPTPSGGGQRADPGQKHKPGGTDDSRVERRSVLFPIRSRWQQ